MLSKKILRKKFLLLRKKKYFKVNKSFYKPLIKLIKNKKKTKISLYYPSNYEVDTKPLFQILENNKNYVTLTAVRPPARFGALKIKGNQVVYFKEKSSLDEGWINGGFFVMNKKFIKFIKDDRTYLERKPLEIAAKLNQLKAFKHYGFWQCMDTKRDKERLEKIIKKKKN